MNGRAHVNVRKCVRACVFVCVCMCVCVCMFELAIARVCNTDTTPDTLTIPINICLFCLF